MLPENINCEVDGADNLDALRKGEVPGVYFPFDTDDGSEGLNRGMLVLQGVERPKEDEGQDVRSLSVFQFDVKEQEPMGRATESGGQAEARYGIPTAEGPRKNYIDSWPRGAIDPNRSYLMVVTYYESYRHYYDLESRVTFENYLDGSRIRLPKRYVRRVVCRLHGVALRVRPGWGGGWRWHRLAQLGGGEGFPSGGEGTGGAFRVAEQRLAGGNQLSRVGGEAGRRPGLRGAVEGGRADGEGRRGPTRAPG